jgi:peptidoglycan hydrolase-like protein with peptidoglycan-binding domain
VKAVPHRLLRLAHPYMTGNDVRLVQRFLGVQRCGPADGVFGAKVDAAVRWYQRGHGLPVDGVVGPATLARMGLG